VRFIVGFIAVLLIGSCDAKRAIMKVAVGDMEKYFGSEQYDGSDLVKLTDRVYTYRWTWYRSIVIDTDEGLVVTDPFNAEAAASLRQHLKEAGLTEPVHTLFYSHYHLDHTEGGAALEPQQVLAHAACPTYWAGVDASRVLPPTKLIEGDQLLRIGGVEIRLLYLGKTHTDTLYAVYLPEERLLWTADFALVRTILPMGGPDYYFPGAIKSMERLAALDFDIFVPSHFGYGKKQDLVDYVGLLKDLQDVATRAMEKFGREVPRNRETLQGSFDFYYDELEGKYGDWHGFDENVLFVIVRTTTGARLGY
jgi:glyoxylase-like metal-dependent hydrolase (beta-lactamase superfamily II)